MQLSEDIENEDGEKAMFITGYEGIRVKLWFNKAGEFHREKGPAVEMDNGTVKYFHHNKLDREDGPAIIWSDGRSSEWYIKGVRLTDEEVAQRTSKGQLGAKSPKMGA